METAIRNAVREALTSLGIDDVEFSVEHPVDASHGDFATNAALICAKREGSDPRAFAEKLIERLTGMEYISAIEVAGPGFINFRLDRDFFVMETERTMKETDSYGKNEALRDEEVLFEYTSPNLFKPLHVGNLVGNIIGESISRLLENSGALVHRINYPSDIGLTVAKGVWGLMKTKGDPTRIEDIGEAYRVGNEAYESDPEGKAEIEEVNRGLYEGNDLSLLALREQGLQTSKLRLRELCEMLGTTFDLEIYESEVSSEGKEIVESHIGDVFEKSDGAVVFPGEQYGLHTRVFITSQGLPTYEAKDVGNFAEKTKQYPSWTHSVIVTGNEQQEYFKVLAAALRRIYPEARDRKLEHIPTGFLTLTTGKMSSRKGNVLTGESVLAMLRDEARERAKESRARDIEKMAEWVSVGALKYQILRQSPGQDIVFDKARALSLEGDSGPYLMYTHARAVSVERKAHEAGLPRSAEAYPREPYDIERVLYRFPEVLRHATEDRAPHHLISYLTDLASRFNRFYATEKIVDTSDAFAPYKLMLTSAVRIVLDRGLYLLGMPAPEEM